MLGAQVLLEALEDLGEDNFQTLKWHLTQSVRDGCRPIARCHLEGAKRTHTVSRLLSSYDPDTAVDLCVLALKRMNQNNCAQELQQAYAAEKAQAGSAPGVPAAPGAPAAPAAPGVPASQMTALGRSVIVAPSVIGGSIGTWNITISK